MLKLMLKSSITKRTWEYEVTDEEDSRLFYHFSAFTLAEKMDEGEYEYELYDDETLVAQGLLQIGNYTPENKTYIKEENGYKQYSAE